MLNKYFIMLYTLPSRPFIGQGIPNYTLNPLYDAEYFSAIFYKQIKFALPIGRFSKRNLPPSRKATL